MRTPPSMASHGESPDPRAQSRPPTLTLGGSDGVTLGGESRDAQRTLIDQPAAANTEHAPELGVGDSLGRYVLVSRIGAGGMGVVYEAYDPDLDRRVAIKLLRPSQAHGSTASAGMTRDAQARLLREAQSLAQLAHPNIVPIYDVGRAHDQIYLAMELVVGTPMDRWLRSQRRSWREVVDVFIQAADGLAAAHAAHLVHRDFKPENVLLGVDGRPRIVDFGLAYQDAGAGHKRRGPQTHSRHAMGDVSALQSISGEGHVAGTPSYMAPEQHRGTETDARCDQYAFFVSLYEALYDVRPFRGPSLDAIARAKQARDFRVPDRRVAIPTWLRELILKGLEVEAIDRHESMAAVASQMRDRRSPRRRRIAISAAIIVACASSLVLHASIALLEHETCEGTDAGTRAGWNDVHRQGIARAFAATGLAHADVAANTAIHAMDERMQAWSRAANEACRATHVDGIQPPAVLTLRVECLDAKLADNAVVVANWLQADERIVEKSATVLGKLAAIEDCSDPQRWMESAGLPRDPDARARALELETQYLQAKLSHEIGRIARAKQLLHACIEDAEDIGFRQLQARSHIDLAQLEADFFAHTLATQHAVRAMELAESSGDDALAAFVAIQQVWVLAYQLGRADQADALIAHARAHVERSPSQTELRETLLHTLNAVYGSSGRLRDAESSARELIELLEARGESLSPDLLLAQKNLGVTLTRLREFAEAEQLYRRVYRGDIAVYGRDHPRRVHNLSSLADLLLNVGRPGEALTVADEALAVIAASESDDALGFLRVSSTKAAALEDLGRRRDALVLRHKCFEVHRQSSGYDDPYLIYASTPLIQLLTELGEYSQAEDVARRMHPVIEHSARDPNLFALAIQGLGAQIGLDAALERFDEALDSQRRIVELARSLAPGQGLDDPGAWELIVVQAAMGACEAAVAGMATLVATMPEAQRRTPGLHNAQRQALLLERCGQFDAAAEIYGELAARMRDDSLAGTHLVPWMRAGASAAHLRGTQGRDPLSRSRWRDELRAILDQLDAREFDPAELQRWVQALGHNNTAP